MLTFIEPLPVGNAVRVMFSPVDGGLLGKLLRRLDDQFAGPDDPDAAVIDAALYPAGEAVTDITAENLTTYFYRDYWRLADASWVDGGTTLSAECQASYRGDDIDPQLIVRTRVEMGLKVEVARGALSPAAGSIPVTTAPFQLVEGITFPTVSVHLDGDAPSERGIGEFIGDTHDFIGGDWTERTGWRSVTRLGIVGVSLNGDERIALRRALRRIIIANLPIFAEFGLTQIEFSQQDTESGTEDNAILYRTDGSFVCHAPAYVEFDEPEIREVDLDVNPTPANITGAVSNVGV